MSLGFMGNILCAPAARQPTTADSLRKMARFCTIVCGFFTLSFFSVTSAFADENYDRVAVSRFYLALARLNARAIACQYYVSVGRPPINRKLMQHWDANKHAPVSRSILYITVKEIRAKLRNLTLAERRSVCEAELRRSILYYTVMRSFILNSALDRGTPPHIEPESLGLQ